MTALIGIDWGSTNMRAFRFGASGEVLERRASPRGAAGLTPPEFESVLTETVADWTDGTTPIVLAGMVGGRTGWREAPYLPCPASPSALAAAALPLDTALGRAVILPGLSTRAENGSADVMRGEETQLLGAGLTAGLVVLPGTHSKWATLEQGRITTFATAMTGELYALLRHHSLLGQLASEGAFNEHAFARGVTRALDAGNFAPLLFSTRADVLLGDLPPQAVESYLSGLLIGGEIAGFGAKPATLIGNPQLVARYETALRLAGINAITIIDGDHAASRGLWAIGECL
ncbi:2-dehydro-3-deoxygalactonokinase [Novosphingobium sp. MMS21-SN21R]|uniref:2-dehydro-3-deoxygalactonokinase n=1 Tax=Novosphingobium sp. MMS21-SN21R TaxID=2969298 RepID=UPI002886DF56|nr:2-dehydro-3-deoxygalactonokinase [Novosphingobium sp. MMS21-SN21R]MDT0510011.1 2-dehydro-3-deoxygalactonokinase [Novosphingobium sp. MMS21-SN21R]